MFTALLFWPICGVRTGTSGIHIAVLHLELKRILLCQNACAYVVSLRETINSKDLLPVSFRGWRTVVDSLVRPYAVLLCTTLLASHVADRVRGAWRLKLTPVIFSTASKWYARALRQLELRIDFCKCWALQCGVSLSRAWGVYCFTLANVYLRDVTGTGGYTCNYGVGPV